jgi:hypothetical protein
MFVDSNNWDDCKKYFEGTWVKFKEEGDNTIWYINEVTPKHLFAKSVDEKEIIGVDLEIGYTLDYVIPKKTTYQLHESAVNLSRIPARQWKKGMNKQNTLFQVLTGDGIWLPAPFQPDVINGFVNKPGYYTPHDALREFKASEHLRSAALNPRMSIARNGTIFVDTVLVARFDGERLITKSLFVPEISAMFPEWKIKTVK